jgi:hypothetical protein
MALRNIGGEMGVVLVTTCNIISTFQSSSRAVGDIVGVSTSGNWCINSTAAATPLGLCGRIVHVDDDGDTCSVAWFGYNKVWENTYSAACAKGSYVVTDTSNKVKASGTAAISLPHNVCVALDYPSSGKVQFLST